MKLAKPKNSAGTFYIYGSDADLSDLKKGVVALSNDWSILEPFLSFATWHQAKVSPIRESDILDALKAEYQKLPENIRSLLVFEEFLKQRDKLEPNILKSLKQKKTATEVKGFQSDRLNHAVYLRLFPTATNHFAWQTLANNHQGFCIAVSASASFLQPSKGYAALLKPVDYAAEHTVSPEADNPVPGAFNDDAHQRENNEWRMLLPKGPDQKTTIKLGRSDVVGLYFSVNASEALRTSLENLVQYDQRFKRTTLFQVLPDLKSWRLTAEALENSSK